MGVTGLLILLQMLLVNVRLVTASPTACDIVDQFIRSAIEQEKVMKVLCPFPEDITVPDPSMNAEWRKLQISEQEVEVQQGLTLILNSVPKVMAFISECRLEWSPQKFSSDVRTLNNILERVNTKTERHISQRQIRTLAVRTFKQFFAVYKNFLQGKYKTLLLSGCKRAQHR
ncbi:erythropoietin [Mixophyes fleayi]|uniref:erythropoietin n=1 Tax=Mixophyes fleayi TaxID=3061075 RepID=UPI003F4E2CC3